VWAETQAVVDAFEEVVLAPPPVVFRVHVHATEAAPKLEQRVATELAREWGEGTVGLDVAHYAVTGSFKAYGLEALRSFD